MFGIGGLMGGGGGGGYSASSSASSETRQDVENRTSFGDINLGTGAGSGGNTVWLMVAAAVALFVLLRKGL